MAQASVVCDQAGGAPDRKAAPLRSADKEYLLAQDLSNWQMRRELKLNLQVLGRWKIVLTVGFLLLFGAELRLLIRSERTQMLARTAQKTAARLIDFAQARSELMQRNPNESLDQYENRISAENSETQSEYLKQFYGQVAQLRDEFVRRGVEDQELDEFYQKPVYPIGIREVGERLSVLAASLRSKAH